MPSGGGSDGAAASSGKANLKFATWSMMGAQVKFGDGKTSAFKDVDSAGLNLKGYAKVSGNALPNLPIYIEVAIAEQDTFENLYKKDTTSIKDGLTNFLVDSIFDPLYFYGGQDTAKTYLGHLKIGLDTPVVNYVTGYKYAKLPPHTNVNWITIDKEWEAGYNSVGGYNQLDFGPALRMLLGETGIEANLVLGPNRTADRAGSRYGFYGYANVKFNTGDFSHYVDFQYNGAYGTEFAKIFDDILEDDFILGYQGMFGPVTVKANALYNLYGSFTKGINKSYFNPAASDVGAVDDAKSGLSNLAFNVNAIYSNDIVAATLGARARGVQANMMYVEEGADDHTNISDQLGSVNTLRFFADVNGNIADTGLNIGIEPYVEMALQKDEKLPMAEKNSLVINAKPYFSFDLEPLTDLTAKVDGYVIADFYTNKADKVARGTSESQFYVEEAGLRYSMDLDTDIVKGVTATYALDNQYNTFLFNSIMADLKLANDYNIQLGCGLRTAEPGATAKPASPFGFYIGGFKKLPVLYKPTAYVQFMSGMDPYNAFGDGPTAYKLDNYCIDRDTNTYDGQSAVRVGLQWDL